MTRFMIYYVKISAREIGKPLEEKFCVIVAKNIDSAIRKFYKEYPRKEYEVSGYDEIIGDVR